MPVPPRFNVRWWPSAILPLLFSGIGLAFLPLVGTQDDEVLFATAIFHVPAKSIFTAHVFDSEIPLMLLSYLGALKSWLYFPILTRMRPSYLTIRLPVLLIGTLTIWLFAWFLRKSHGPRAAWIGGLLLATDTVYLLTTCFDWGPVVLQHLLALTGMAFLLKFLASSKRTMLFWGFFVFGAAFWDKALFFWFFSGLAIAAAAVFPRELWSRCTPRNLSWAAAGLFLGALPLVAYNAVFHFETFRSNSSFKLGQFPERLHALRITWDGESLFGYMAHPPQAPGVERDSGTMLDTLSAEVRSLAGPRYHNELVPAFWVAVALLPFLCFTRARKALLFCLIAMSVGWLQMAITKDAGLGAHHVVLLWPLPHWFLAVAFAEASLWKPLEWHSSGVVILAAAMVFLAGENLLLTDEYFYQLTHFGTSANWTDAIFRLSSEAGHIESSHLVLDDWGILNALAVLHRNRLPLVLADQSYLAPGISAEMRRWDQGLLNDVWIGHTPQFQQWGGENERIVQATRSAGFEKQIIETVPDRNGHPVFEIFRFVRHSAAGASNLP
ncbi:MAG: hypothetical protein JOZ32_03700 [Bryobacterales bacterium]|nr:hypothetical protein [Bryobacterales bacterium]